MIVCYLGGFGRSGSTLLERMLATATGACALGEVVWLWERGLVRDERCGCGERFSKCPFWLEVGDLAFGGWHRIDGAAVEMLRTRADRARNIPRLAVRRGVHRRSREYSEFFAKVYAAAAQVSGSDAVIDSSKHPSTAYNLRLNPRIRLRVVHVVRDSRGVAYSWTKKMVRPEVGDSGHDRLMYRYPPWKSAVLWDAENLALSALGASGVPTFRLKYEEFLADPARGIRVLAEFLGVPLDLSELFVDERSIQLGQAHQISGNPMRFNTGRVVLREDDEWRSALAPWPRVLVSTLTAPLLAQYGYLRPTSGNGAAEPRT